jgi:2-polyprenyl-3-methyl-5-hydroxy-6-metoxy-1,4-benzoquinol methylase
VTRPDWTRRSVAIERMESADAPEDRVFRTLDQFRIVNRLFARHPTALSRTVLRAMRRDPAREYRLTDLGAGGCDIDRWLVRRCRGAGLRLRVRAIERDPRIRRYAAAANAGYPEIEVVAADALDAAAWGAPDFVFANHLLHHLSDEAVVELLRRLDASGARYILSDLVRSRGAVLLYALFAGIFFRGGFLCEDGLISIRRGFTRAELNALIARAGLRRRPLLRRRFPFRWHIVRF